MKARALLAILLLHRNELVLRERLVDQLWGERPPRAVAAELRVYVAKLRKVLGSERIATRPEGYVLLVHPDELDADRFERAAREGTDLLATGDAESAARLLGDAVGLWRGAVLADLSYEPWAEGPARRLGELRLTALEERLEAELALGRHARLVPELQRVVMEQPYRERPRSQLMLALYRCGRQSEALELYLETARVFAKELGIEPGPELTALQRAILNHDPSLRLVELATANLPVPPTPLIGRQRELDELAALLGKPETRLVTLTGAGGSGKTHLAIDVAARRELESGFPSFFVELSPLTESELVLSAIARTIGLEDSGGTPLQKTLAAFLRNRSLLLVLDNFEHLLPAASEVATLLARVPGLTVLVTSRRPLHLRGEWRYEVGPLAIADAISLFIERAKAVDSGFESDAAVEPLCQRLDRLPLAIELAAARVNGLAPPEILIRMADRLALLAAETRDAPERQQTMRAAIDWSYRLLSEPEQRLFSRLGVFAGGCRAEQAEAVTDYDGALELDVPNGLRALVEKSLLRRRDDPDGEPRFWMLETIREFANETRQTAPGAAQVALWHGLYFRDLALAAEPELEAADQADWLDRLSAEDDNLRAALDWSLQAGQGELGLRIAVALRRFWEVRGHHREGLLYLSRLTAVDQPDELLARALRGIFSFSLTLDELDTAQRAAEERSALCLTLGDADGANRAVQNLGVVAEARGDLDRARELYEEVVAAGRELQGEIGLPLNRLAFVAWKQGRLGAAEALFENALTEFESSDDVWSIAFTSIDLASVRLDLDQRADALHPLRRALLSFQQLRSLPGFAASFDTAARASTDAHRAARLLGKADGIRDEVEGEQPFSPYEQAAAKAIDVLGQKRFDAAHVEGRAMSLDDAIVLAYEVIDAG